MGYYIFTFTLIMHKSYLIFLKDHPYNTNSQHQLRILKIILKKMIEINIFSDAPAQSRPSPARGSQRLYCTIFFLI